MPDTAAIKANANGIVILQRPISTGMPDSAHAPALLGIIRDGEFELLVDVPPGVLGRTKIGQSVEIETLDSADIAGPASSSATWTS